MMKAIHAILCFGLSAHGSTTIDPIRQYAWSGNIGWMGWDQAVIGEYVCSGHVWIANCGWATLGDGTPTNGIHYGNNTSFDYGVNVKETSSALKANLRGFAYAANIGWLHFEATGNPEISLESGCLSGSVWSPNCGWVQLDGATWFVRSNTLQPGTDTDHDGITDAYELEHTNPPSLESLTTTGDFDGDGQSDVDESIAGSDPTTAQSSLAILSFDTSGNSSALTWTSSLSRMYRISSSTSLLPDSWQPVLENIVPDGDSTTRSVITAEASDRFFRVESYMPLRP